MSRMYDCIERAIRRVKRSLHGGQRTKRCAPLGSCVAELYVLLHVPYIPELTARPSL